MYCEGWERIRENAAEAFFGRAACVDTEHDATENGVRKRNKICRSKTDRVGQYLIASCEFAKWPWPEEQQGFKSKKACFLLRIIILEQLTA